MSISKTLNSQLEQAKTAQTKIQSVLNEQFEKAGVEVRKILKDLGVSVEGDSPITLKEALAEIKQNNASIRELVTNIDIATYDVRNRFSWNAHMLSALAELKALQAVEQAVENAKPKLSACKEQVEDKVNPYIEQANGYSQKVISQVDGYRSQVETAVAPYREKVNAQLEQLTAQASSLKEQVNSKLGR
jgi:gas vesicle protein